MAAEVVLPLWWCHCYCWVWAPPRGKEWCLERLEAFGPANSALELQALELHLLVSAQGLGGLGVCIPLLGSYDLLSNMLAYIRCNVKLHWENGQVCGDAQAAKSLPFLGVSCTEAPTRL